MGLYSVYISLFLVSFDQHCICKIPHFIYFCIPLDEYATMYVLFLLLMDICVVSTLDIWILKILLLSTLLNKCLGVHSHTFYIPGVELLDNRNANIQI